MRVAMYIMLDMGKKSTPIFTYTHTYTRNTVVDLTFFLLPGIQLPLGSGVVLYYSVPPFTEWTLLGALTLEKPRYVGLHMCRVACEEERMAR